MLDDIGRPDLKVIETVSFAPLKIPEFFGIEEDEIDDELRVVKMPESWKRCYKNPYLKSRGFMFDDYEYFPVGTTRESNGASVPFSMCRFQTIRLNLDTASR